MAERVESRDWILERLLTVAQENEKKTVWLAGAFFVVAFIALAMNLGAVQSAEMDLLFFKSTLTDTWPIRALLSVITLMIFLAIVYMVIEAQKSLKGVEYLALREHDRAAELGQYGVWLLESNPQLIKMHGRVALCLIVLCLTIVALVNVTFAISLFI